MENRFKLRVWSEKAHKYLTDADIWDIFDSDAEDVWELLSEVNRPTTKFLEQQLREYKLTFEQCTGIRDYLNTLIYEGDIIKNLRTKNSCYKVVAEINDYSFKFVGDNDSERISCFEKYAVIGNIHENKDLLEGDK